MIGSFFAWLLLIAMALVFQLFSFLPAGVMILYAKDGKRKDARFFFIAWLLTSFVALAMAYVAGAL